MTAEDAAEADAVVLAAHRRCWSGDENDNITHNQC